MDVARAMGILGFNSSRWLDASQARNFNTIILLHTMQIITINIIDELCKINIIFQSGNDPKAELDKAQFTRMQELLKKKRLAQREKDVSVLKCTKIFICDM